MLPLMMHLYTTRLGEAAAPLRPRIDGEIDNNLALINGVLEKGDYLLGSEFTGADVQMSFVGEVAGVFGKLAAYPAITAWLDRLHARPAFKISVVKGGAYAFASPVHSQCHGSKG
jgi:glutathione S-transferase